MKKFFVATIFVLIVTVSSTQNVSAESYDFSADGYTYTVITPCIDYAGWYTGWDKVYLATVFAYKNGLPQASTLFTFGQTGGTWYYNAKNVTQGFAPVSSNSFAQSVFNSVQRQIADFNAKLDREHKAESLHNVGMEYLKAKLYEPAILVFEEYKKFDPTSQYFYADQDIALCYAYIAAECCLNKDYRKALENFEKAEKIYEVYKADFLRRFSANMSDAQFERTPATKSFRRLLYQGLSLSYSALGNNQKAVYNARRYNEYLKDGEKPLILPEMQSDPEYNHETCFNIALSYRNSKNYDKAIWYLERAISIANQKLQDTKDRKERHKLEEALRQYNNRLNGWRANQRMRAI